MNSIKEMNFQESPPEILNAALHRGIYRFVYGRVRNHAVAEDLTQDILVKAVRSRKGLREQAKLESWIFRIARNRVNDYFRTSKENLPFDESLHTGAAEPDAPGALAKEEEELRSELRHYIRAVVEDLPRRYRDALLATEFEDLSQVEYARRAGISLPAAKSRVQRARREVRGVFERCCEVKADVYGAVVDVRPRRPECCAYRNCKG